MQHGSVVNLRLLMMMVVEDYRVVDTLRRNRFRRTGSASILGFRFRVGAMEPRYPQPYANKVIQVVQEAVNQ